VREKRTTLRESQKARGGAAVVSNCKLTRRGRKCRHIFNARKVKAIASSALQEKKGYIHVWRAYSTLPVRASQELNQGLVSHKTNGRTYFGPYGWHGQVCRNLKEEIPT